MQVSAVSLLVWLTRLSGLAALGLGLALWAGRNVPLHAHMGCGGVLVLALWALAVVARKPAGGAALVAVMVGAVVPILGLSQLFFQVEGASWLVPVLHLLAGVSAIGAAEAVAKRARRAALIA